MLQTMGFSPIKIYFIIQAQHTEYFSRNVRNDLIAPHQQSECVNFGVIRGTGLEREKILFWMFVSTWS